MSDHRTYRAGLVVTGCVLDVIRVLARIKRGHGEKHWLSYLKYKSEGAQSINSFFP